MSHDELWRALDAAGDERSHTLLEQFVPGDVYHVDSIIWNGAVAFAVASKYGKPPMEVAHQGGLFITKRLADGSDEGRALLDLNLRLQGALGLRRGVSHTEFIRAGGPGLSTEARTEGPRAKVDGFVFLETSARVGGAFIVDTIEAATGLNLWREWARIEVAGEHGMYAVPPHRDDFSGIVLTLARQEAPDMSAYTDAEIAKTIKKDHHAGLIVSSPDAQRVDALIADYAQRFYRDFFATAPPPERPVE
jgi:biotin carboxylase